MRILHFADLHIGVENYGRIDSETGFSTRLLDSLNALDEVVEYALTGDVSLVILAGDAYKSRDPSQTQQREFAARLSRLSLAGIPVFLLVGNHDLPHAVGRATTIDIFDTLRVPNIHVGDHIGTHLISTAKGLIQIVALPWPRRSRLLTREDTHGMSLDMINERIQELLALGVKREAEALDPTIPAVLTAHVTVSGATVGSERSMMLGKDHVLLPSNLHIPTFDYIALGHIHKHQEIRENPLMAYAGSLQRVDFGEEGDPKGFCVVDLDPSRVQGSRLIDYQFKQVRARNFVTVSVDVQKDSEDPTNDVKNAILRKNIVDAVIRVQINLTAEQAVHIREAEIRDVLKSCHFVAAINQRIAEERRARIASDVTEGLDPLEALSLYFDSRNTDPNRKRRLLKYAQELVQRELSNQEE